LDEGPAILGLQLRHITPLRQRLEEGLAGVANALGWSTVAIYLLLALGYGYFLRAGPSGEQRKGRSASVISRRTNPVQPQDG